MYLGPFHGPFLVHISLVLGFGRIWDRTMSSVQKGSGLNQGPEPDFGSTN